MTSNKITNKIETNHRESLACCAQATSFPTLKAPNSFAHVIGKEDLKEFAIRHKGSETLDRTPNHSSEESPKRRRGVQQDECGTRSVSPRLL